MLWKGRRQSENIEDRRGLTGRGVAWAAAWARWPSPSSSCCWAAIPRRSCRTCRPPARGPAEQRRCCPPGKGARGIRRRHPGRHRGRLEPGPRQEGQAYREPKLVLFTRATDSACGYASRPPGPSTAPGTKRSTSTSTSSRRCSEQTGRARRFRPGLRHRPRGRPPRAEPARHHGAGRERSTAERDGVQPLWCGWSCRPTSWPASGPTTPSA